MQTMERRRGIILAAVAALGLAACGGDGGADADGGAGQAAELPANRALYFPDRLVETAPEIFRARFETTAGDFVIEVRRAWAPRGADRVYNLVKHGFYDGVRLFRVIDGFVAQFGIHGEPQVQVRWAEATIVDDLAMASNTRGTVTFAKGSRDSRTTQLFINLGDNSGALDHDRFAPVGEVVEGMDAVDAIHSGYGDLSEHGGLSFVAHNIGSGGNAWLDEHLPELDHIVSATIVGPEGG